MLGVVVCAETIRTLVESHGAAMATFQPRDVASGQEFQASEGGVEFTIDAGKVNTCADGWRDIEIGVFQKRKAGAPVSLEDWDEQRLPAPTARLAFAEIAPSKMFRQCWREWLQGLGVAHMADLSVLADGASWIWKSAPRVLTGCLETLDIFHACQRLKQCADRVFGDSTSVSHAGYERGRGLLLAKGWAGVCEWVGELLGVDDVGERERRQKATTKLVMYFAPHVGRLNYAERLASGRAIGSGAVEGQAKTLGLRLKARGAQWRIANVNAMASLVCVRHSDQFEAYWSLAA
ncbi:hypothetical protein FRUB_05815 [Fimbriiglobus ruber]|uniref:Mobile element protein n=2 Tax=Fimbriiglobus ruber TaxID=1908690 RepID=A0A225DU63_9BACT|nr:hypothetical protein FRUB_05815 [Fimbriiglobus ruber]